ncbi:cell division initiation protein [Streptomyces sp. NPDC005438]|uniref:cell division initiation protein n=1 Tax=Streptomyces sp. NPDC005438 TaxID=3156880 RepID=UPI0033B6DF0C
MDVQQRLDEIVATIAGARSMPMSASCVVNRAELLEQLEEVRQALPGSLAQAQEVLGGREQVVADAQREAQRIVQSAETERETLVAQTQVAVSAQQEADRILAEARREAELVRAEADDYVDSKLANFEVVLGKTVDAVERGREKLLGAEPSPSLGEAPEGDEVPERTADPEELRRRADSYVDARLGAVSAVLTKTLQAVGRGRKKLLGHRPIDELADHIAAQDGNVDWNNSAVHASDDDYLAGLAIPTPRGSEDARQAPPVPPAPPTVAPQEPCPPPQHDPYVAAAPEQPPAPPQQHYPDPQPTYGQDPGYPQADPYYTGYPQQGYDPYGQGYPQHGYDHQHGAYQQGSYQGADPSYQDPHHYAQQQYAQPAPEQSGALDETSLFDTSMIDIDQLRQYEQGHGR